jgi:hypothetical protein
VLEHADAQPELAAYAKERGIVVNVRDKEAPVADAYEATYSAIVGE